MPLYPSIVLAAYLEPLVEGRRVALLGDATLGLAEDLLDRGARLVHAYDPERTRVAEARPSGRGAPWPGGLPRFAASTVTAAPVPGTGGAVPVAAGPTSRLAREPRRCGGNGRAPGWCQVGRAPGTLGPPENTSMSTTLSRRAPAMPLPPIAGPAGGNAAFAARIPPGGRALRATAAEPLLRVFRFGSRAPRRDSPVVFPSRSAVHSRVLHH